MTTPNPKVKKVAKKVAVFDVDGTIFRSSLFIELMEALIDAQLFPQSARRAYMKEYERWLNRHGPYEEYIEAMVRTFREHLRGVPYGEFADLAGDIVAEQRHRTYRYTRDLIQELRRKGYFLLAISQSPKTILDGFCTELGFHKVYGRIYEIGADNRFTGEVVDLHLIENKAHIVKRALEKEGLTLKGSVGVGDTEGDIPFLELVERPICFNPNMSLYRYAKRMDWGVVVERKDVIYKIAG